MEVRTQIVTQLVAGMISNNATELSITEMVIFARDIADEIIQTTYPEEIAVELTDEIIKQTQNWLSLLMFIIDPSRLNSKNKFG